jgi:hypothetical protein
VLALAALVAAGAGAITVGDRPVAADMHLARATGGVGLGPAAAADWSFHAYDPRIEATCEAELWPVPGGPCYVPHHGATVADLPPLGRR